MNRSKLIILYYVTLLSLTLYSYALLDPNITIINHQLWTEFRNGMVQLGYYHRHTSASIFLLLMSLLFVIHLRILKKKPFNPMRLSFITAGILILSYPFLSRDLFNYMFDARILTVHHANPYLHAALDFPDDQWLRFMHWTHRSYPYGPTFLPLTLIPSFLSMGKFVLNLLFFKAMFAGVYIWTVYMLSKIKKEYGLFFATHPVVLIEGLVNNHNDLIAVMFAIMGIYYGSSKVLSFFSFLGSAGIKFITTPSLLLFAHKDKVRRAYFAAFSMIVLLIYLSWSGDFQQWYVVNFFIFIPILYPFLRSMHIFFYGVLFSYIPFILFGEWNTAQNMLIKYSTVILALCINIGLLYFRKYYKKVSNL